jgi:hypothetical protein
MAGLSGLGLISHKYDRSNFSEHIDQTQFQNYLQLSASKLTINSIVQATESASAFYAIGEAGLFGQVLVTNEFDYLSPSRRWLI